MHIDAKALVVVKNALESFSASEISVSGVPDEKIKSLQSDAVDLLSRLSKKPKGMTAEEAFVIFRALLWYRESLESDNPPLSGKRRENVLKICIDLIDELHKSFRAEME